MREHIVRKIIHALLTLFAIVTTLFILFRVLPINPSDRVISQALDEVLQHRLNQAFGLEKPLYVQYVLYLKNLISFEWGHSFSSSKKVFDILQVRFWNTIILMGVGLCLTLVIGTGLGMIMAWRVNRPSSMAGTLSAIVIQSIPPFVIALLLLMVLSYRLELFPTGGIRTPGITPSTGIISFLSLDFFYHLILPTITLIIYYLATLLLIIRNKMLEVIDSDFVLMARAKGLAPHVVIFKYAAQNAIMAVVALSAPMIGFAVSSQIPIEQAFNWPGLGKLLVQSAASHDYPVLQATFIVLTALMIFLNLILDIVSSFFNPTVKYKITQPHLRTNDTKYG
jgi:peptide/nickel transport system permease protein